MTTERIPTDQELLLLAQHQDDIVRGTARELLVRRVIERNTAATPKQAAEPALPPAKQQFALDPSGFSNTWRKRSPTEVVRIGLPTVVHGLPGPQSVGFWATLADGAQAGVIFDHQVREMPPADANECFDALYTMMKPEQQARIAFSRGPDRFRITIDGNSAQAWTMPNNAPNIDDMMRTITLQLENPPLVPAQQTSKEARTGTVKAAIGNDNRVLWVPDVHDDIAAIVGGKCVARWNPRLDHLEDANDNASETIITRIRVALAALPKEQTQQPNGDKKPMDLQTLAKRSHDGATKRGFDVPTWKNLPIKLMLVVTELDEAVEAAEGTEGKDSVASELADVALRLLASLHSICGYEWADSRIETRYKHYPAKTRFHPLEVMLWPIVRQLRRAVGYWRNDKQGDAMMCLELAVLETFRVADILNINLIDEALKKLAKNETRPQLHGTVRSEG